MTLPAARYEAGEPEAHRQQRYGDHFDEHQLRSTRPAHVLYYCVYTFLNQARYAHDAREPAMPFTNF